MSERVRFSSVETRRKCQDLFLSSIARITRAGRLGPRMYSLQRAQSSIDVRVLLASS